MKSVSDCQPYITQVHFKTDDVPLSTQNTIAPTDGIPRTETIPLPPPHLPHLPCLFLWLVFSLPPAASSEERKKKVKRYLDKKKSRIWDKKVRAATGWASGGHRIQIFWSLFLLHLPMLISNFLCCQPELSRSSIYGRSCHPSPPFSLSCPTAVPMKPLIRFPLTCRYSLSMIIEKLWPAGGFE